MFKRSSLWFYIPPPVIVATLIGLWQYRKHQPPGTTEEQTPDPVEQTSRRHDPPPPSRPTNEQPPAPVAEPIEPPPPAPAAATAAPAATTLAEANAIFAELAGQALPADRIADWLRQTDLLNRIVSTVDLIATGASPRDHLDFLAPAAPFSAQRQGTRWYAAAANAVRTKAMVETFCMADANAVAAAYPRLEPVFDQLYRDLGYPNGRFRDALTRACQILLDTPIPEQAPALVRHGTVYRYSDPAFERLKPAQKHLLRLGLPDARRVQQKVGQLAQALGLGVRR